MDVEVIPHFETPCARWLTTPDEVFPWSQKRPLATGRAAFPSSARLRLHHCQRSLIFLFPGVLIVGQSQHLFQLFQMQAQQVKRGQSRQALLILTAAAPAGSAPIDDAPGAVNG